MKLFLKLTTTYLFCFVLPVFCAAQYNTLEDAYNNKEYATTLRLAGNNIDEQELSDKLGTLTQLEELTIISNILTNLPEELGKLQKLKKLVINSNALVNLPASITKLKNLEFLDLKVVSVTQLPDGMNNLQGIRDLTLHFGGEALPEDLFKLRNLEKFELKGERLQIIPSTFGKLSNLEHLTLKAIKLSILPKTFSNLSELKELSLYNCDFAGSGSLLFDGKSYDLLGIHRCKNIEIVEVENCKAIKKLIFQDSYATELPKKFHKMNGLEVLEIGGENISDLEEAWKCKELKSLTIGSNKKVKSLPSKMKRVRDLENLNLACSELRKIPEDIEELTKLKILFIQSQQLAKLPQESMSKLESLEILHLNCPKLTELPVFIQNLPNLKEVVFSRMHFSSEQVEEIKSMNPNARIRIVQPRKK